MKIRKRILVVLALAAVVAVALVVTLGGEKNQARDEALMAFKYDASRMDVGTCYEYKLTDQKKTKEMSLFVYVKAPDEILIYKDYSTVIPEVLHLDMKFDWQRMMFAETYCGNPFWESHLPDMNKEAFGKWDFTARRLPITMIYFDKKGREAKYATVVEANNLPTYDLSIYHLDLQFAMRHMVDDSKPMTLGGIYMGFYIESVMRYTKDEMIDGRLCKRYDIRGKGLLSIPFKANQRLWVPKDDPLQRPIRYENDMVVQPFDNVVFTLQGWKTMTNAEWDTMVADFDKAAKTRLKLD